MYSCCSRYHAIFRAHIAAVPGSDFEGQHEGYLMLKRLALAGAAALLLTGSASAQQAQAPKTPDDCLKAAFDLSQAAEEKQLADEKLDKVEELLTQMETYCDANQFNEAMALAQDIKTVIDGQ